MDSLSSVSPSIVLPPTSDPFRLRSRRRLSVAPLSASHSHGIRRLFSSSSSSSSYFVGVSYSPEPPRRRIIQVSFSLRGGAAEEEEDADGREDVERALHLDGTIPGTSDEFVKRMSSRAYDMRRHLHQTFDSSSYDEYREMLAGWQAVEPLHPAFGDVSAVSNAKDVILVMNAMPRKKKRKHLPGVSDVG